MRRDRRINVDITADVTGFRKAINGATGQVQLFGKRLNESLTTFGGRQFAGIKLGFAAIGAAATAAAVGGLYMFTRAMSTAIDKSAAFETAAFQMQSSLAAASREFDVGPLAEWEKTISELSTTLKIYSETDLRNAASRTVDMTKRLGLSSGQMKEVIRISGELGAGKTDLTGAVERVTAALRGEAESAEYLGLTLSETYVKGWYEANNATGKAWKNLTDLEKAQVRYQVVLEQASPLYGKAAASVDTYAGSLQAMTNDFEELQKELGGLVTNNTFVIESFKVLSEMFKEWKAQIAANRGELVNLVKDGVLLFIDGIGLAVETLRFFYNGWQGLKLLAHGAVVVIVKGLELVYKALMVPLKPLELLLDGLEKIGLIDSNPLKDFGKELEGFADFSVEDFKKLYGEVEATNKKFDDAKGLVEDFRKRIADIPAEYKDASESIQKDTKDIEYEVVQVGDTWVQVAKDAQQDWSRATDNMIRDVGRLKREIATTSYPSGKPAGYARGGNPFHGGLGGYGGGDRRLILVEDGEHVIRKEAVARLGHGFFQRFNSLNFPALPKFASGGPINGSTAAGPTDTVNINLSFGGGRRHQVIGSRQTAAAIVRDLQLALEGSS